MERGAIRGLVLTAIAAVSLSATAQNFDLAASGFAVAPPPGYVAAPGVASSPSHVVVSLTKPAEPGTACEASFEALPGFEQFSQDALNRQTDNPGWEVFYRDGLADFYAVTSVERFDHLVESGKVLQGFTEETRAVS